MTKENIIELNGKQYDALSGKFLGLAETHQPGSQAAATAPALADGVVELPVREAPAPSTRRPAHQNHQPHATHHAVKSAPSESVIINVRRSPPHHVPAHQPQHSQTLMRRAVAPPGVSLKRTAKAQTRTDVLAKQPNVDVMPKHFVAEVDEDRLKRARHVARNQLIRHFDMTAILQPQNPPAKPAPAVHLPSQPAKPVEPSASHAIPKQRSQAVFDRALANATSHKQPPYKAGKLAGKRSSRLRGFVSVTASTLAIVVIIGFIAYQNASAIQLRLAASRSGVNATLPGWRPEGFTVGAFSYKPGAVSIKFTDAQASRSFTVSQSTTSWDSSALLSDFVLPNNETFDTIQAASNTIYTYGNNNATWVSGGVWYKLTTDGSLSTSQLVKLASSM